jgi:hypothetical protein
MPEDLKTQEIQAHDNAPSQFNNNSVLHRPQPTQAQPKLTLPAHENPKYSIFSSALTPPHHHRLYTAPHKPHAVYLTLDPNIHRAPRLANPSPKPPAPISSLLQARSVNTISRIHLTTRLQVVSSSSRCRCNGFLIGKGNRAFYIVHMYVYVHVCTHTGLDWNWMGKGKRYRQDITAITWHDMACFSRAIHRSDHF